MWSNSAKRCQSTWCNPPGTPEPGADRENSTRIYPIDVFGYQIFNDTNITVAPLPPPWEDFEERIINVAAKRVDDRGWSLADHLLNVDEGSPNVPMPAGN